MNVKMRLKSQLEKVRALTESLLKAFQTPEEWTYQVDATANHALWFVGHISTVDNFFISLLAPNEVRDHDGYRELFGIGSQPVSDPSAYPPVEEVLAYWRERRQTLLKVLDAMSEEDLARSVPDGSPAMWTDFASVLETAIWHETLHAGQVSVARKALGHAPLLRPSLPARPQPAREA